MEDGLLRTQQSFDQGSLPPPRIPSTMWCLGLMVLGGLISMVLSRLWQKITAHLYGTSGHVRGNHTTKKTKRSSSTKYLLPHASPPPTVSAVAKKTAKQFRDKGLDAVMEKCKAIKSQLRTVDDPEIARKAKIAQLLTKALPRGPLQITPDKLQIELQTLRSVELAQRPDASSTTAKDPLGMGSSFLQDVRRNLKPVAGSKFRDGAENRHPKTSPSAMSLTNPTTTKITPFGSELENPATEMSLTSSTTTIITPSGCELV